MTAPSIEREVFRAIVRAALEEDLGDRGDVTTDALVDAAASGRARIVARETLVVAGLPVAEMVFEEIDRRVRLRARVEEGEQVGAGVTLAEIEGPAAALLRGERTALNFLMRACGIAAAARAAAREVEGTRARVLDTRKTAPGLRRLDKYAVAVGGASNHRMGLYDAVMIKDTHLALVGSIGEAVRRARRAGHPAERITVEVTSPRGVDEAIEAGAGRVLLDNMDPAGLRACVARARGRVVLEASGGLRPGSLRVVAQTGVDFLSLGWLTHSARAADLAMEMEVR